MDFQDLQLAYDSLPPLAKQTCARVATTVLGKALGTAWNAISQKIPGTAFAGIYRQWREDLAEAAVDDEKLTAAFEEFFSRPATFRELDKLLRDQYAQVDFGILGQQLRESCEWAGCPAPQVSLHEQLDGWVRCLRALLEDTPQFRRDYQVSLQNVIRELSRSEALVSNHSQAREKYLASVVRQHRHLRFSGMAEVSGPAEVEMSRVFIMPRVIERAEFTVPGKRDSTPFEAYKLLTAKKAPRRWVVLGGPGTGKSTLFESLCLGAASRFEAHGVPAPAFSWAHGLPALLPIFYRIRDLDRDLEKHCTIWDCIRYRCSRQMGLNLPADFFPRQMENGGLLVLFDGLDEAASPASRDRIPGLIEAFVDSLSAESRVGITSRPYDYRRRFEAAAYRHYELCEFDDGEVQTFIHGWRMVHEPDRAAAIEKGERLWKALEARPEILPLAGACIDKDSGGRCN